MKRISFISILFLLLISICSCNSENGQETASSTTTTVTTTTTTIRQAPKPVIVNTVWSPPDLNQDLAAIQKCNYYKYNNLTKYDSHFKKYTKQYFGINFDYLYLKSQSIAESNLNPNATSQVGAQGLMQIMPSTYKEISNRNPELKGSIKDVKINIGSGVYYMSTLWNGWKKKNTWIDHWDFCTSSYNAGMGNIIKAQDLAKKSNLDPNCWISIEKTLPKITGTFSKETIDYVARIKKIRSCLI